MTTTGFYVTLTTPQGHPYWLRSTVWAGALDRATTYPTEEAARAALAKAKPFTKPALFRLARITPALEQAS